MASAVALGFLVGFPIAAAPGPMFFLVLRRTLAQGWRSGLIGGLGIATGDAIYAALAAFGVAAITNLLIAQRRWIALAGGIAIAVIGVRTLITAPTLPSPRGGGKLSTLSSAGGGGATFTYASMVALTLSNPPTILSFAAVFAGLGLRAGSGWPATVGLVAGVLLGSTLWWVVVTGLASLVRERVTPGVLRGIALASGLVLIGFGVVIAGQAI